MAVLQIICTFLSLVGFFSIQKIFSSCLISVCKMWTSILSFMGFICNLSYRCSIFLKCSILMWMVIQHSKKSGLQEFVFHIEQGKIIKNSCGEPFFRCSYWEKSFEGKLLISLKTIFLRLMYKSDFIYFIWNAMCNLQI